MRHIVLFLLTFSLISPAIAKLEPLNPPATQPSPAPSAGASSGPKLTPDGKIQIGYDKRADYRLIKQPTGDPAPAKQTASVPNTPTPQEPAPGSLDGNITSPAANTAPAPSAAPVAAKPRSDSALRSDSSPAREAAAKAQAEAAAKAAEEKKKADALAAAITAAQKAGALPLKPQ